MARRRSAGLIHFRPPSGEPGFRCVKISCQYFLSENSLQVARDYRRFERSERVTDCPRQMHCANRPPPPPRYTYCLYGLSRPEVSVIHGADRETMKGEGPSTDHLLRSCQGPVSGSAFQQQPHTCLPPALPHPRQSGLL
ncbi:hypothetical protein SKAU_G00139600 [Synaphobranchus kaupii]|uniref:Uncharacterized protein n=1 Tax=Synaphobranchus kaupii TaxID=118154 RepID=A0A9Q1FSF0_SYNKA|nr:hypothetical protein SKAU_G00139600 [Synaphobranchus kaupii]